LRISIQTPYAHIAIDAGGEEEGVRGCGGGGGGGGEAVYGTCVAVEDGEGGARDGRGG